MLICNANTIVVNFLKQKFYLIKIIMASIFIWSAQHLSLFQSISNWLLYAIIWGFLLFLTYTIIWFIYDLVLRSKAKNKKWLLAEAFKNAWSLIWLPLVAFLFWFFSWLIIALYIEVLSKIFPIDLESYKNASEWTLDFVIMSALYNLILLEISSLLLMFSFKNKIICWVSLALCLIWFILPLIAAILSVF